MQRDQPSADDRRSLQACVTEYFKASIERNFAKATSILYPGDLDKFRKTVLWCARAMMPFGETRQFLDMFGEGTQLEDLEVLAPPVFVGRFLERLMGTDPSPELDKVLGSLSIRRISPTGEDTAEVVYSYDAAPWETEPCVVERTMQFQRVGDQWFGLLDPGFMRATERVRRDVGDFERRSANDADPRKTLEFELEPFSLHGYRDSESGRGAIEPRFADAGEFSDGLAPVKFFHKWGFINYAGETVIEPRFDNALPFSEGWAPVAIAPDGSDLKWGYIDRGGDRVCEFEYDCAEPFSEGLAAVMVGELWGYIAKSGELVIEPQFASAETFEGGEAEVTIDTDNGIEFATIDREGNRLSE